MFTFILAFVFLLIMLVGLVGNMLVLLVIALNKQMQESTSLFICNLALADLLFLAFCVPLTALSYLSNSWPIPEQFCYVTVSLQYATCYVSVWTLVLLAHDRFVSITSPAAGLRRARTVSWTCGAVWCVVLAMNSLQLRHVGVVRFEYNGTSGSACVDSLEIAWTSASLGQARLFYWGFNSGAYLLPLAMSSVFYFLLVKEIWRQKLVQSKSSQKMKRHATRMVFIVILTFGVCWLPQNVRFFLRGLNYPEPSFWERDEKTLLLIQSIAQTLAYANSCVNPIIYGLLSERFRMAFLRTLSKLCCRSGIYRGGPHHALSGSVGNLSLAPRTPLPPPASFQLLNSADAPTTIDRQRDSGVIKSNEGHQAADTTVTEWRSRSSSSRSFCSAVISSPNGYRARRKSSASVVQLLEPSANNPHKFIAIHPVKEEESWAGAGGEHERGQEDDDEVIML